MSGDYGITVVVDCKKNSAVRIAHTPDRNGEVSGFSNRPNHALFTQGRLTFAASEGKSLLNLAWLEELIPWFAGRMAARLKDEKQTELTVARDRVRDLRRHLGL